ncbi:DUF4347 domain-containing protein, partial [Undibacterium sp. Ji50W]|uniref:DUF4347 domain-containing protein n=1 Tax=Undibacterium sp. Ji50W TaxID=3413041 RepID=UPI003BF3DAD0
MINTPNSLRPQDNLSEHDNAPVQAHDIQVEAAPLAPPALTAPAPATMTATMMATPAAPAPVASASNPIAHDVVFVDSRVTDSASLLKGLAPNAEVVFLDKTADGLQQMADYLAGHQVNSVQIVAHGFEGQLWLGKTFLDNTTLNTHSEALANIGKALVPGGDILVYSCNLAAGDDGASFVSSLATLTGADVAASSNRTGAGGDWDLEVTTGKIEATSALSKDAENHYDHSLATVTFTNGNDTGAGSLRNAIAAAGAGDTVTSNASRTVTLTSGQLTISQNLTINGDLDSNGTPDVIVDANYNSRVLTITTGNVTLNGLVLEHGLVSGNGGAYNSLNGQDALGAGLNITGGTVTIKNSTITANVAAGGGGNGGGIGYGYGGGGGGGFSSKGGGNGGAYNGGTPGTAGSAGTGGTGGSGGAVNQAGKGGSTTAGAGGTATGGLAAGGNGGRAGSVATGYIGGGGAGAGASQAGTVGLGGNAAGGIYIANGATVYMSSSSVTNNLGAGGGGAGSSNTVPGANGGIGIGGILNKGALHYTNASVTTSNNYGSGGAGGGTQNGQSAGTSGSGGNAGTESFITTGTGTADPAWGPTVTSATYDASTGILLVTGANMTNGGTIDVTKLTLTGQGGSYTLTGATSNPTTSGATSFSVTLDAATDRIAVNGILNKNGTSAFDTTTFNLAAATNWDVTAAASADLTGNAVTVSNVTAPTITSATYNVTSHVLTVTGTNLVRTIGATNDITVSKLTITGEGGATQTLSVAQTGNVEINSATSFSITIGGTDVALVEALFNKNGTTSTGGTTYNLAAADTWDSPVTGSNNQDLTGNGITVSNVPVPTITSATYNSTSGVLVVTGTGLSALTGATNDIVANKFTLTGEGGATYTLTNTANVEIASSTSFTLTLSATDKSGINQIINKNGTSSTSGTTYNLAAAEDWAAGADAAVVIADLTGNGITASNVAVPAITSATYDAATGNLVITGTGFTHLTGATNDIVANKFTIKGQANGTYTLTDTANVEITSDTSFTLILSTTDKAGVRTLLNNNGTSSGDSTTYNLAAAEDWTAGADAAVVVADLTGNGITASNVVIPTITSATYDASAGTLLVTGTGMVTGDAIVAANLTLTGQSGGTYALTSGNTTATSATSFTITLSAADKLVINGLLNNNGTNAVSGTTFNLAGALNWDSAASAAADATNGVTVSNVTAPTITSAAYDAATGILTVTGTGLVSVIGATNDITVNKLRIVGEGGTGRTLVISSNVEITDGTTFSVQLSGNDRIIVDSFLNKNGATSTSGSTYNVVAFDDWNSTITNGDISDATNPLTVSNVPVPTITSATYDATTGTLLVTGTGFLQLTGANNDIVANKFTLTGEGGSTYTLTNTSNVDIATTSNTQFTLVLSATDKSGINQIINKNGTSSTSGTTYNLAAAEDWTAGADAAVVVADLAGNGITASNVAVPAITSATYDAATGNLVITGTGFTHLTGTTNDIVANKFTIKGQANGTYTLTDTANVEITSDTSFTLVLSTTDKAGVRTLLNANGTSSGDSTTYNLAAAEDWTAGADAAVVVADLTGNGITVSNVVIPTITSATYDASAGTLLVTGTGMVTGDAIVAANLTLTGDSGGTYALTSGNTTATSATSFTITLSAADKLVINGLLNNNGTNAVSGTTFNLAGALNWDSTVGAAADATNAVTVSNVTAPTITSATYDGTTHIFAVTGTNLVKTIGATNDV